MLLQRWKTNGAHDTGVTGERGDREPGIGLPNGDRDWQPIFSQFFLVRSTAAVIPPTIPITARMDIAGYLLAML